MRYENLFYLRGLFERFPPTYLPYSITLNGLSSPESDLDLSHTNINGDLIYSLHKGMASQLNNLNIKVTLNSDLNEAAPLS
jgi:hypothetical protein